MSTEFTETDSKKKEESPIVDIKLPTIDLFGVKIKMHDAQNILLLILGTATAGMAINTFAPRLNPFNKPKEEPATKKEEQEPVKKENKQQQHNIKEPPVLDVIEYEPMNQLPVQNDGLGDVVDRLYDDPETVYQEYKPNKRLSYKEIDDIFGSEKLLNKRRNHQEKEFEGNGLEISSDLL